MKKISIAFLTVVFSLLSFSSVFAIGESESISGKAFIQLVAPYTPKLLEEMERVKGTVLPGWIQTDLGFVKYYPVRNATVSVNGVDVAVTDEEGKFSIPFNTKKSQEVAVYSDGELFNSITINEEVSNNESLLITQTVNFYTFMDNPDETLVMDNPDEASVVINGGDPGSPYYGGFNGETLIPDGDHYDASYLKNSYVTCNRFNGYEGDMIYYPKDKHPFLSIINFNLSDCDYAIYYGTKCLDPIVGDYGSGDRICKNFAYYPTQSATCSQHISHKALFHKHTTKDGPSGY